MNAIESTSANDTVQDRLIELLRARDIGLDGQARPDAILWTDPKSEWLPIITMMQAELGELLVLGDYNPEAHTGPAIWLRCVVDKVLDDLSLPEGRAPILYLPGVAKQDLRAGDECREDLRPIVELMYRGTIWTQQNGNDWGVSSFLISKNGLNLDISRDNSTSNALLGALGEVIISPVAQL